jgi:hypothetical protein
VCLVVCELAPKYGATIWAEPIRGTVTASINIELVRIGLVRSVDWKLGTGIDHIAPAPTTYPMTQVGYDTVFAMYKESEHCQSINVCINNDTKGIILFFSSAG